MAEQRLKIDPRDGDVLSDLAGYWAVFGERSRALNYLDRSLTGKEKDKDLLLQAAVVYNQLGETGPALEWLSKALAAGYSKSVVSKTPDLDNLHNNPRYQESSILSTHRLHVLQVGQPCVASGFASVLWLGF